MKWMRWAMVDEMNGIDFGIRTQKRWNGGKIMWQHKHNCGGEHKHKQNGYRASSFCNQYFHFSLLTIFRWFDCSSSWLTWVSRCLQSSAVFSEVCLLLQVNLLICNVFFWFDLFGIVTIIVIFSLNKTWVHLYEMTSIYLYNTVLIA